MAIQKKNIPNSPRLLEFKKNQQRVRNRKIFLFFSLGVSVFIGLVALSRWSRVNILDINISGNKVIETETVQRVVAEDIKGNYLWLIPKTNFLFYPKQKILHDLENNFNRLKDVTIDIVGENILEVSATERQALYTWCGAVRPETPDPNEKCYFLDGSGYIFDEAPFFSGDVYFKFYGLGDGPTQIQPENPLGGYYFKNDFAKFVSIKEKAYDINLKPIALTVSNTKEAQLFLKPGKNIYSPKVLFKIDSDFEKIIGNLQTAISTDPLKTKFNNNYISLLYIDLRFGNKVYFKFSDGQSSQATVKIEQAVPAVDPTTPEVTPTQQ